MNTGLAQVSIQAPAQTQEFSPEYWMDELKSGNEQALAHLMTRFQKPIHAFLQRRLKNDSGVIQELTQEVFLKCFQHCQRFESGRPVAAWLFTLAANASVDHIRKHARELPTPEDFDLPDLHPTSPWEEMDQARKQTALNTAMEALTPRQKAIITAYYTQEKPIKEVAQSLGCAEGTVKATLFQSLAKLRKHMEVRHEA